MNLIVLVLVSVFLATAPQEADSGSPWPPEYTWTFDVAGVSYRLTEPLLVVSPFGDPELLVRYEVMNGSEDVKRLDLWFALRLGVKQINSDDDAPLNGLVSWCIATGCDYDKIEDVVVIRGGYQMLPGTRLHAVAGFELGEVEAANTITIFAIGAETTESQSYQVGELQRIEQ